MQDKKKDIQKELSELSPLLAKLRVQTPQDRPAVPEGYFDTLPDQVMDRIRAEEQATAFASGARIRRLPVHLRILKSPGFAIGVAAVLTLLIVGRFLLPGPEGPDMATAALEEQVDKEALYEYVMNNIHEFDTETIMDAAGDTPIDFVLPSSITEEEDLDQLIDEFLRETDISDLNDFM